MTQAIATRILTTLKRMKMVRMLMTNDDDDDKDKEDTEADEDLSTERIPRSHPAPERGTELHLRRRPSSDGNIGFTIKLVSIILINSY